MDYILAERNKKLKLSKDNIYELDDQLLNVIAKSLSYDAENRFQTAQEFIKAIDGESQGWNISLQSEKILSGLQPNEAANSKHQTKKMGEGFSAVAGMEELKQQNV